MVVLLFGGPHKRRRQIEQRVSHANAHTIHSHGFIIIAIVELIEKKIKSCRTKYRRQTHHVAPPQKHRYAFVCERNIFNVVEIVWVWDFCGLQRKSEAHILHLWCQCFVWICCGQPAKMWRRINFANRRHRRIIDMFFVCFYCEWQLPIEAIFHHYFSLQFTMLPMTQLLICLEQVFRSIEECLTNWLIFHLHTPFHVLQSTMTHPLPRKTVPTTLSLYVLDLFVKQHVDNIVSSSQNFHFWSTETMLQITDVYVLQTLWLFSPFRLSGSGISCFCRHPIHTYTTHV